MTVPKPAPVACANETAAPFVREDGCEPVAWPKAENDKLSVAPVEACAALATSVRAVPEYVSTMPMKLPLVVSYTDMPGTTQPGLVVMVMAETLVVHVAVAATEPAT